VRTTATADRGVIDVTPTSKPRAHGHLDRALRLVDARSTAFVRIVLGSIVAWSMFRYLARGWVTTQLTDPDFHVGYPGLGWVRPLPSPWMHLVLFATALGGVALALGWRTRLTAAFTLLGFFWIESIDAATYLNHYELVTLLLAWATVLPMSNAWSLHRRVGRASAPPMVGAWVVWVLRAQLGIVYVSAGVAKLSYDWLVQGQPLRTWFAARTDVWLIGPILGHPTTAVIAAWAGACFDVGIVAALLWRRTRPMAYLTVVAFHAVTWLLFPNIGLFPIAMILLTPVFFAPNWPSRMFGRANAPAPPVDVDRSRRQPARLVVGVVLLVGLLQVAMPLRHTFVPGDVRWDDYHYRWSWRVMLNERAGVATFDVVDPNGGAVRRVLPEELLPAHLARFVSSRPEPLRQFAHYLADVEFERTGRRPQVHVTAWVSVNGSNRALIVDPTVDLASEGSSLTPPDWVMPAPWS
jgi:hypothetical protein